jgi:hypothetical protein
MNFRRYYVPGSAVFITQVVQNRDIEWERRGLYPPAFKWDEPKNFDWGEWVTFAA